MKSVLFFLTSLCLCSNLWAGGAVLCVATDRDNQEIEFRINFCGPTTSSDKTTIEFDQSVAWNPEALKFDIIFSTTTEETHLIAAQFLPLNDLETPQIIEIHFDLTKGKMKNGYMKAGDQLEPLAAIGKYRRYSVDCF